MDFLFFVAADLAALVAFAILVLLVARLWLARLARVGVGVGDLNAIGARAVGVAVPAPPGAVSSSDLPETFSGVEHAARYQAPEVLAEALEAERDRRWVRAQRMIDGDLPEKNEWTDEREKEARGSYSRSLDAKSLDELRALDGRALGIPCVRCGRKAEAHPEFPRCSFASRHDGTPLPPPPPRPTRQATLAEHEEIARRHFAGRRPEGAKCGACATDEEHTLAEMQEEAISLRDAHDARGEDRVIGCPHGRCRLEIHHAGRHESPPREEGAS